MLAQNFKSAADLEITEPQRDALQKTLTLLETDALKYVEVPEIADDDEHPTFSGNFNMIFWKASHSCGTAACIGGTAEMITGVTFTGWHTNKGLLELFYPRAVASAVGLGGISPAQAATALRSYLTTGDAKWLEAVGLATGDAMMVLVDGNHGEASSVTP